MGRPARAGQAGPGQAEKVSAAAALLWTWPTKRTIERKISAKAAGSGASAFSEEKTLPTRQRIQRNEK